MARKQKSSNKDQDQIQMPLDQMEGDLYSILRSKARPYDPDVVASLMSQISEDRLLRLASVIRSYIDKNLGDAINKRSGLSDYRTNPYVLLTSANVLKLSNPKDFGQFLFNNKLYAGLETSFGKSIEAAFVSQYPIRAIPGFGWDDPKEKVAEFNVLKEAKLTRQQKAQARNNSVWREIDKSCIIGDRRYLVSIKSGPNCINDTQVAGMVTAIANHHRTWLSQTIDDNPEVQGIDIAIGITYGTDLTTNNKENQILAKLQDFSFSEESRTTNPGVLINETGTVRVYRCIGQDFWAFIGDPTNIKNAPFVFLEVMLALSKGLSGDVKERSYEDRVNAKITQLATAILQMRFPRGQLPQWIREDFSEDDLFWLATALTAFFDQGI